MLHELNRLVNAKGSTTISTLAAMRGQNPPGTRARRRKRQVRQAMAKKSRRRNRRWVINYQVMNLLSIQARNSTNATLTTGKMFVLDMR